MWRSLSRPSHCDKGPDILRTSQGQMLWSTERCCEKTRGRLPNSQCYVGIQQTGIYFSWGLSNFLNSLGSPWFSETIKHIYLCLPSVPANIWSLTLVLCFLSLVSDYILERVSDGKIRPKAHKTEFKQLTIQGEWAEKIVDMEKMQEQDWKSGQNDKGYKWIAVLLCKSWGW